MKANRPSSLPIAQYCGLAGSLKHGAGRGAAMSRAFHAACADAPDKKKELLGLTEEEAQEIMGWLRPTPCTPIDGVELDYGNAAKELTVTTDSDGQAVDRGSPLAYISGRLDMAWIVDVGDKKYAVIADIKKTKWMGVEPNNLQNLFYGFAFADKHCCDMLICGLWFPVEGEWSWGSEIDVKSIEAVETWERILYAADNHDEHGSIGAHCQRCYSRFHCPEHMLPAITADSWLAPLREEGITRSKALDVLLKMQALASMIKTTGPVYSALKEYATRAGGIADPATGKQWVPVQMPGRLTLSKDKLAAKLQNKYGDDISDCYTQGAPYTQMKWIRVS